MAVVTTLMASPIFEVLVGENRPQSEPEPDPEGNSSTGASTVTGAVSHRP
jgi:hypothetical protein